MRILTFCLVILCMLPLARADRDASDHERAVQAVQAGTILPLDRVLQQLQNQYPGQVLEVELEDDDGRWIYEIKLLQAGGLLRKIKLDARTAAVLHSKTKATQ